MNWHDLVAMLLLAAATAFVVRRAARAWTGSATSGCGGGCRSCGATDSTAVRSGELLSIDAPPDLIREVRN